jgi:Protein of unknown function (DUF2752)
LILVQLSRRHLRPGELDHELVWLSVSLASLGMAAVWFSVGLPWPRCAFHDLTGWPCLTCGATRAAVQFFHGHFLPALMWNPLAFAGLCAVSIFNIYAALVLVVRAPRLRIAQLTSNEKAFARIIAVAALVFNWCYLLGHWRNFS